MTDEWRARRVGDIAEIYDGPHATPRKTDRGPWFLSISSLQQGRLVLEESAHLSDDDFIKWTRRVTPVPGDVLFSYETRLGEAALMPEGLCACLGRRMGILRPRNSEVNPRFLLYAYLGPGFQSEINRRAVRGATVDRIPLIELGDWLISVPDRPTQDAIAEVLGALDDKYQANVRLTHVLDELWRAEMNRLLNGWDVSEGSLPSGWSRVPLSSLARFVNGRNFTKDASGSGRMVVRIAELNSGPGSSTVYNDIDVPSDHVARPGDLLFAWSGSLTVQRWYRPEAIVNQHIFKVLPTPAIPLWMVHGYLLRLLPWYRQVAADKATTMGHIQRHHLDELVVLPDASTREKLGKRCASLWDRALAAERESLVLVELRDALLPRLLSGDIRVREAETLVSDAV